MFLLRCAHFEINQMQKNRFGRLNVFNKSTERVKNSLSLIAR